MEEIQRVIKMRQEEEGLQAWCIVEGVTIRVGKNGMKDRYMAEYSVKGPSTEYVMKVLKENHVMKEWCSIARSVETAFFID